MSDQHWVVQLVNLVSRVWQLKIHCDGLFSSGEKFESHALQNVYCF